MGSGTYKTGVLIDLVYQAAGLLADAQPVGTVIAEDDVVDSAKTVTLTSSLDSNELTGVAAGRYLGHFTPDAEGGWTIVIKDKNSAGEVSKKYEVCGHDLDSIGDAIIDTESGLISSIVSDLVDSESGLISSIVSELVKSESGLTSQLLLTKSAIVSSVLEDFAPLISDVESAVDLITSPAIIS